jgi:hypothetical protein
MQVDAEDFDQLRKYLWYPVQARKSRYAAATIAGRRVFAHRLVAGANDVFDRATGKWRASDVVDHINGNGLDNRRANLRIASRAQNQRNTRGRPRHRRSAFKGVSFYPNSLRQWRATIEVDRRQIHLGYYESQSEAAHRYNEAAIRYFGEFAFLNNIPTPVG